MIHIPSLCVCRYAVSEKYHGNINKRSPSFFTTTTYYLLLLTTTTTTTILLIIIIITLNSHKVVTKLSQSQQSGDQ